jgi:indole-3-glycerol phosphate synthase
MNLAQTICIARKKRLVPVIAEIKRRIPKLEALPKDERKADILAQAYQSGGACGISLVTEIEHFGGQPEIDIPAVLHSVDLPLLIKDFMLEKSKVDFYSGLVSGVHKDRRKRITLLLTTHWLGNRLQEMLEYVHSLDMLALVETRQPSDLFGLTKHNMQTCLVGFNNKYIDELEKGEDIMRLNVEMVQEYHRLANGCLLISQSAHTGPPDVVKSINTGADAVLVGTAFMRAREPESIVHSFVHACEAQM